MKVELVDYDRKKEHLTVNIYSFFGLLKEELVFRPEGGPSIDWISNDDHSICDTMLWSQLERCKREYFFKLNAKRVEV